MKRITANVTCLIVCLAVLTSSCKKNQIHEPDQSAAPFQVSLNEAYIAASKVDSAFAIWEVNGSTQIIKLQVAGNKLTTSLDSFKKSGAGILAVQLYTQTKVDNIPLQWEKRFPYTLNRSTPVSLAAPADIKDTSWSPRLIYVSNIYNAEFTAILALRPEDPYFELKGVVPQITKRIEIVRSYYQNDTSTVVASKSWTGQATDLDNNGNLVNRAHFQSLAGEIGAKAWNKIKFRASFYAQINPAEIYEAETVHNKP
jgi:hypothetical protein